MKTILATVAVTFALLLNVFVVPVSAQNNLPDDSSIQNQTPGTTTTDDNRGGFDLWWLLPLLAIPLFFVLFREDRSDDREVYRDRGFAGTKGGEVRRQKDTDEEDFVDDEKLI
jgi:hypothetical protein